MRMPNRCDVEAGYEVVERIKNMLPVQSVQVSWGALGGFGGMFDLSKTGVKEPVLISGTDGVGTKLMLAIKYDKHDTIGQDCVAMCVNDIIAAGAEPLYFLDYVATGKMNQLNWNRSLLVWLKVVCRLVPPSSVVKLLKCLVCTVKTTMTWLVSQ